ncbi:putative exoribonuclease 2 [Leptomonas seymouri]|uniref:Putative exoribonuclease 2 n=1 Tax=Leptomonas seymouri TaxID=5684 RepID=A0A0N1HYA8_LEPSE|nr:putative exoribonuclease 2 [Leptomonas seymouri]|eukprot:KPI87765.1 putative exoribonuclease 2 [Leptomonas seymouri]
MGIAGFFLWLQRWYGDCIDNIPQDVVDAALRGNALPPDHCSAYSYDNLYIDMNGLIHPCCHDTAPLPEPENEEEMFERMFDQLDLLVKVVRPKKCLVLCIDGVAPRSKMNQQRSRRFRAADERLESDAISNACADRIVAEFKLPRPRVRERWDHNVITPSTAFMERVALALEWYIMKKLNEDESWHHLAVVFSDAHVPGEGEHKIMQYIRGLRSQPGYNFNTTHVIHGMDADLICLGLSTHEKHVSILRNQLTDTFQPDHSRFCYFNLHTYRERLKKDFEDIGGMLFERVVDDFIFLCFFVGNDFLPHVPLVSIKTRGIELLLDHYVRDFPLHGYLTQLGEVDYAHLHIFLSNFASKCMGKLSKEYYGVVRAKARAKQHVEERVANTEARVKEVLEMLQPDGSNAQEVSDTLLGLLTSVLKERARLVVDKQPLGFSYLDKSYRDAYYHAKFGWDPSTNRSAFESQIRLCCAEYLRGMQWVMRYYTKGCPSWEWYFPYHYAPLLQDLAAFTAPVNVEMRMSAPLHPVEQLLAVLPRLSVNALPEELHDAVNDPKSVLGRFYPEMVDVDFSEANFSYQGVLRIPFINCEALSSACREVVEMEDDFGSTFLYCHESTSLAEQLDALTGPGSDALPLSSGLAPPVVPIPTSVAAQTPVAGRVGRYEAEWPRHEELLCPDPGMAKGKRYGGPIASNCVNQYRYELSTQADYRPVLLGEDKVSESAAARRVRETQVVRRRDSSSSGSKGNDQRCRRRRETDGVGERKRRRSPSRDDRSTGDAHKRRRSDDERRDRSRSSNRDRGDRREARDERHRRRSDSPRSRSSRTEGRRDEKDDHHRDRDGGSRRDDRHHGQSGSSGSRSSPRDPDRRRPQASSSSKSKSKERHRRSHDATKEQRAPAKDTVAHNHAKKHRSRSQCGGTK